MADININEVIFQRRKIGEALEHARRLMVGAPEGSIVYRKSRGKTRYYKVEGKSKNRKERYISSEHSDEVLSLVQKRYYSDLIARLEKEAAVLDDVIKQYDPNSKYLPILDVPAEYRTKINPLVESPVERCRRWQAAPFESNQYPKDEGASYVTPHGEIVRSRAEYIIADILSRLGLVYHYEQKLILNIGSNKYEIYPDFTIMHPRTGQLYYLEFFGMMDNSEYMKDAMSKIKKYQAANLGARLITIFDCSEVPMDNVVIETTLMNYFGLKKK